MYYISGLEGIIVLYVFGLIWKSLKQFWKQGSRSFFHEKWNV